MLPFTTRAGEPLAITSGLVDDLDFCRFQDPIYYLCPDHLTTSSEHVTGIKYNYAGTTIVASYNDDDAYTMDTVAHTKFSMTSSTAADASIDNSSKQGYIHRFSGHRNNDTVKQICFFGSRSEWVVSGSDCGHIFMWSNKTGDIVKVLEADSIGAVNCFDNHPYFPILASSGLENDAKIWSPIGEHLPIVHPSNIPSDSDDEANKSWKLWKSVSTRNLNERRRSARRSGSHGGISSRMMMQILRSYLQDQVVDESESVSEGASPQSGSDRNRLFRSFLLQAWASSRGITVEEEEEESNDEHDEWIDDDDEAVREDFDGQNEEENSDDYGDGENDEDHDPDRIDLGSDDISVGTCEENSRSVCFEVADIEEEEISFVDASLADDGMFSDDDDDDSLTTDEEVTRDLQPFEDSADVLS